jgi:hypothetical protein
VTRSNTLAVAKAKLGARDRRNRAIVKQLAAGASTRAVGAEFGLTTEYINRIRRRVTGARIRPAYAPWSAKRVARLRLLWLKGLSTSEIGRLLGVSKSAVAGKIDRLELPAPSAELQARKRRHAGRSPFWHANRIAKLRKLWGTRSNAAIASELGISKAAALWRSGLSMAAVGRQLGVSGSRVFAKVHELGLPPRSPRPHPTWPPVRVAKLRALQRKDLSLAEIGQGLGVSKRAVACKISRLKSQSPQA